MLKRTSTAAKRRRLDDLRRMLEGRRAQLAHDVQDRIRSVRTEGLGDRDVVDAAETSEVDIQGEIGFALIQLKSETLKMIDTALRRIEQGDYGDCFECGREIAEARLRALPFAVRCRDCEAVREAIDRRERSTEYRDPSDLFVD
jgi:RNA polymerase-binding transcription factor